MYYQVVLVVLALAWRDSHAQCTSLPGNAKSSRYFTAGGTVAHGTACCFPFIYKFKLYNSCITLENEGIPWCSTDSFYDKANGIDKWGNCVDTQRDTTRTPSTAYTCSAFSTSAASSIYVTTGGTVPSNTPCCFPFVYKNKVRESCITDDNNGRLWCSVESIYEPTSNKWGNCVTVTSPTTAPSSYKCNVYPNSVVSTSKVTTGGNVPAKTGCCFPFAYKGKPYYSCTSIDNGRAWCSPDSVYQGRWGNCVDA